MAEQFLILISSSVLVLVPSSISMQILSATAATVFISSIKHLIHASKAAASEKATFLNRESGNAKRRFDSMFRNW